MVKVSILIESKADGGQRLLATKTCPVAELMQLVKLHAPLTLASKLSDQSVWYYTDDFFDPDAMERCYYVLAVEASVAEQQDINAQIRSYQGDIRPC